MGHSKRVNSVKWLRGHDVTHELELVSGSADSTVTVWSLKDGRYEAVILEGHESNVNIVDGLYQHENHVNAVIVSASMDNTVRVWLRPKPGGT